MTKIASLISSFATRQPTNGTVNRVDRKAQFAQRIQFSLKVKLDARKMRGEKTAPRQRMCECRTRCNNEIK